MLSRLEMRRREKKMSVKLESKVFIPTKNNGMVR
tara:strand:+ start:1447 stop:1548 length:102 start_codon:yes stop_codon:yes gene_type:complete